MAAARLISTLQRIEPEGDPLDRRLVSVLWMIPLMITWQIQRMDQSGVDGTAISDFEGQVEQHLHQILGHS